MTRGLDPTLLNYLQGRKIRTAFLVEADFGEGMVRLTTHTRNIEYNGNTYYMAQTLIVNNIEQTLTLQNNEANISLSGIPTEYKSLIFNQNYIGRKLTTYQAFFDFDTDQIVYAPIKIHEGIINNRHFLDDVESGTATINLPITSIFARFDDKNGMMTNPSTHKKLFPNDTIFDQVPELVERVIEFGKL